MSQSGEPEAEHLRWNELPVDDPLPKVRRRHVKGVHAMLSRFELAAGCEVPSHEHANEQFACVLEGRVRFRVGKAGAEVEHVVGAGELLHLPPFVLHAAYAIEDSVVLDVFAPPSESTGVDRASHEAS